MQLLATSVKDKSIDYHNSTKLNRMYTIQFTKKHREKSVSQCCDNITLGGGKRSCYVSPETNRQKATILDSEYDVLNRVL